MRWVYGTRTDQWYLVDETDRDYEYGITMEEMAIHGPEKCKDIYLSPSVI